jgi:hypothetical protein
MMNQEAKIYLLERELHFPKNGDGFNRYVAVAWQLKEESAKDHQGDTVITTTRKVRVGEPYIRFTMLREFSNGFAEDEDSPVAGGLSLVFAKEIARELELACVYLEGLHEERSNHG